MEEVVEILKFKNTWLGLFAMENITADDMMIEYVVEVIRYSVADERCTPPMLSGLSVSNSSFHNFSSSSLISTTTLSSSSFCASGVLGGFCIHVIHVYSR